MYILAVDPSLNDLGIAIYDDTNLIYFSTFKSKGKSVVEKLGYIQDNIGSDFPKQFRDAYPNFLAIEDVSRRQPAKLLKNFESLGKLNKSIGVLFTKFRHSVMTKVEFVPTQKWKGSKKKEKTISEARFLIMSARLELPKRLTTHSADAIMLGNYFVSQLKIKGLL